MYTTGNGITWASVGSSTTAGSITITSPGYSFVNESPGGTALKIDNKPEEKGISPRLMFKFVKSKFKMNPKQEEWHRARLKKLGKLVNQSKELNQISMFEELSKILAVAVRESEMQAYFKDGVKWINKNDLLKFQPKVIDKCVYFKKIEEFPRPIPEVVAKRIKHLQESNVFDQIWILYLDYTKEEFKSNAQKVREKDPIAFGCISYNPDIMYYITDWIDERCDLTLDKVVESLKAGNEEFGLGQLPEFDEAYMQQIKDEVLKRHERLAATNSSNWREKEVEAKIAEERQKWEDEMMTKIRPDMEYNDKPGVLSFLRKLLKRNK